MRFQRELRDAKSPDFSTCNAFVDVALTPNVLLLLISVKPESPANVDTRLHDAPAATEDADREQTRQRCRGTGAHTKGERTQAVDSPRRHRVQAHKLEEALLFAKIYTYAAAFFLRRGSNADLNSSMAHPRYSGDRSDGPHHNQARPSCRGKSQHALLLFRQLTVLHRN